MTNENLREEKTPSLARFNLKREKYMVHEKSRRELYFGVLQFLKKLKIYRGVAIDPYERFSDIEEVASMQKRFRGVL